MSLVGSLEDLSLGEIMQIAGISGKSGVLHLRSLGHEIRIFFETGLITGVAGATADINLRTLAIKHRVIEAADAPRGDDEIFRAVEKKRHEGASLDTLYREYLGYLVATALEWQRGEFSFDIGDLHSDSAQRSLFEPGLNPQFVVLEAARHVDECRVDEAPATSPPENDPAECAFLEDPVASCEAMQEEVLPDAAPEERESSSVAHALPASPPHPVHSARPAHVVRAGRAPVVVADPELHVLEWVKGAIEEVCARVHILQRSEEAVARVRQYVLRGESPIALLTTETAADAVSGAEGWADLAMRLRAQVPGQRIVLLNGGLASSEIESAGDTSQPDGVATKPTPSEFADPRSESRLLELAAQLRTLLADIQGLSEPVQVASPENPWRDDWQSVREQLRHAASSDGVWTQVLDFAAQGFERTALFTVAEEAATAFEARIRFSGDEVRTPTLAPDSVALEQSAWLRKLSETRASLRSGPSDDGDREVFRRLGDESPDLAFLAPIERCGILVAVLYGDNALYRGTVPDTRPLEPVLKEAGLALERLPGVGEPATIR